ncbi:MAG: hypothetical protein DMG93_03280 [Acidobacteria bacterium]|nr:MAG: hypothetical protein DMG93_03280 [Acidobacteriota bacterium]
MSKWDQINRRNFIGATAAAVVGGTAASSADASKSTAPQAFRSPAGSFIPYSKQELLPDRGPQRIFTGEHLSEIAFPLGGIGTGTVSLGGRGELRDWEIFNRPGKGKILPFSFVALWSRPQGSSATVKVVESELMPPYRGSFGYKRESAEGLLRFKRANFQGSYPIAHVEFEDDSVPVGVSLEAFNPFVPLNVDDSSLPVAIFQYHLACRSSKPIDVALTFSLLNAVGYDGVSHLLNESHEGFGQNRTTIRSEKAGDGVGIHGLEMTSEKYAADSSRYGSMALVTTHPEITARTSWQKAKWWDSFQQWLDEFTATGAVHDTTPSEPSPAGESIFSTLAPRLRLLPGESHTITFVLAWYFPWRENYWNQEKEVKGLKVRNYYGTRFKSAWEVASYTAGRLGELETKTRSFHDCFFSSTLPPYVLEAVSSQASIIRTNTCMLTEGKQFFAFEGCGDDSGCCPMNCTHVWNYEQALAFLFPELERSMRRTDFTANMRDDGSMAFRSMVPLGNTQWKFKPAADGQMGSILKLYREWQLSGDDDFLRELWPQAKRALEFAWTHWDADRDGVMEGEQHNTYDIEFYGPNTMMGTLYLGALRAAELMASVLDDRPAAEKYRQVREKGQSKLEELWNGEFYIQKIPRADEIRPLGQEGAEKWHAGAIQNGEVRYQYGDGCLSDQLLGQWFAEVLGLGHLLQPANTRKALQSIYQHNFKHDFYDSPNVQRIYALNDEKGLVLCTWPKGHRPAFPFVYSDEVWTGIEYQVAAHLIYEGLVEEGLSIVKGICDRYDGARRNPWNEVECGSHYARALASWSVLLAVAGYRYSAVERSLTLSPRLTPNDFQCVFVAGTAWGILAQQISNSKLRIRIETKYGMLKIQRLNLGSAVSTVRVVASGQKALSGANVIRDRGFSRIDLGEEITIPAGGQLVIDGSL